jgi:coproporphyrinogen III oxidase
MLSDRGVKFGLVPGGRIEAVLVSCPPLVAWDYDYKPSENSEEEKLLQILKQPKDWV